MLPTFVVANLKRVPDTPVADTDICALTENVLSLQNQLDELMGRMADFIELKNQVVEVKANKSVVCELRAEFLDVRSEICSSATQLKSIKSEMSSAGSTYSSRPTVVFSVTTTDFPELPRPAGGFSWAEKTASTGVNLATSNGESSHVKVQDDF